MKLIFSRYVFISCNKHSQTRKLKSLLLLLLAALHYNLDFSYKNILFILETLCAMIDV